MLKRLAAAAAVVTASYNYPTRDILRPWEPPTPPPPEPSPLDYVQCPKAHHAISLRDCATIPKNFSAIKGSCPMANSYFDEDLHACILIDEAAPILECPPGYTIALGRRKLCRNRGRMTTTSACDPPFVLNTGVCERRSLYAGMIGCQPTEVQLNGTCLAANHVPMQAECPKPLVAEITLDGKAFCLNQLLYNGTWAENAPHCADDEDTHIHTVWDRNGTTYDPPLVECIKTFERFPIAPSCPPGGIPYEMYMRLTGNKPVVLFDEDLGNPRQTCVILAARSLQPVCPHTDGKAFVFPLLDHFNRTFNEYVPGLYMRERQSDSPEASNDTKTDERSPSLGGEKGDEGRPGSPENKTGLDAGGDRRMLLSGDKGKSRRNVPLTPIRRTSFEEWVKTLNIPMRNIPMRSLSGSSYSPNWLADRVREGQQIVEEQGRSDNDPRIRNQGSGYTGYNPPRTTGNDTNRLNVNATRRNANNTRRNETDGDRDGDTERKGDRDLSRRNKTSRGGPAFERSKEQMKRDAEIDDPRYKASWLFNKYKHRIAYPILEDPTVWRQSLSPMPFTEADLSELWFIWLNMEWFVPVCVQYETRKPFLKCPETHKFGADGTCKPMDYAEMMLVCPVDYELDLGSLPIATPRDPQVDLGENFPEDWNRERYERKKKNEDDSPYPNPNQKGKKSYPKCIGKLPAVTHWHCNPDEIVDLEHRLCLGGVNVTRANMYPLEQNIVDILGEKGREMIMAVQRFELKRPAPNWYPFSSRLLPMRVFKDVFNATYEEVKDTRLDLERLNDTQTQLHRAWFDPKVLEDWLYAKRDEQIHFLVAESADILYQGMPADLMSQIRVAKEKQEQAQKDADEENYRNSPRWQGLLRRVYTSINPYLRPKFGTFSGLELTRSWEELQREQLNPSPYYDKPPT